MGEDIAVEADALGRRYLHRGGHLLPFIAHAFERGAAPFAGDARVGGIGGGAAGQIGPALLARIALRPVGAAPARRSEEHTSEPQSLMRISYAVFCLKKKKATKYTTAASVQCTTA